MIQEFLLNGSVTSESIKLLGEYLKKLENKILPPLADIPIALLKKQNGNAAIESLEYFLLKKLR